MKTWLPGIAARLTAGCILILSAGGLAFAGWTYQISRLLPDDRALRAFRPPAPARIFASDGTLLACLGDQYREPVPLERIPRDLQNAIVAVEDRRFYRHSGLDG